MNGINEQKPQIATPSIERRRQKRIAIRIPIRIVSGEGVHTRSDAGICNDISEGGATFEADADLNLSETVELEFLRKSGPSFWRRARLLYRLGQRYGAYFVADDEAPSRLDSRNRLESAE